MFRKVVALAGLAVALTTPVPVDDAALAADDECLTDDGQCGLNALQTKGKQETSATKAEIEEYDINWDEEDVDGLHGIEVKKGEWFQGGDKVWGNGRGVENVNAGNVGYYNRGFYAARAHCGGAGCALMVNPPGHRTINIFHIHFVHYRGYGASLHHRLESKTCGHGGWHGGGLPCGGRAKFFPGFPGVFSAAMGGGNVHHASVIAWPGSCGGRGTIVQLAFGCSIEHQIRGDFNPKFR
eukprot:TRINITY_DN3303_c0_g2_i1.p1 TRINITY_DN3303_c0_g2~~TRINITY_DN3303_c0_g2_i1.p1  ORF type:complete len:239 (-),score=61.48 TRINITY_DN3303_c0_g2_i1:379-1095(-)